jgi:hypothetical protein
MAGPANQAAANAQAVAETLAQVARVSISTAASAVTADTWDSTYEPWVREVGNATWNGLVAAAPSNVYPAVYYNRSGPMSAPYGGGWDEDQFED